MNRIEYIESFGFRIKGRYIEKRSESTRSYKVVGQLNDNNFFFHSDNVYPFKQGINSFKNKSIIDSGEYTKHIKKVKENNRNDFKVDFVKYYDTTKVASIFGTYLNEKTNEYINKNSENYYDIRGVVDGYMKNAVLFPFFDYDNNFVTAQIIKYQPNGKRVKISGTNWYHAYKPIKRDLKLKQEDKYSVPVDCFFGEHILNGSTNPIGIVEAPKTAVILKEFYPNIDWVATGGEQKLFNKDLSIFQDRDVVIFADAHTTKWKEFAQTKGFTYCDILDVEGVNKGDDIADYIFEVESDVFSELHNYLFSINEGTFDFEINENDLELDFQVKGKDKSYFTALPYQWKKTNILHKTDDSREEEILYRGKTFDIYQDHYSVLNANVDFHKQQRTEDKKAVGFNEKEFVWHLQKCYRVLKHLNKGNKVPVKKVFKKALKTLLKDSNFSFNKDYVLRQLVPLWDSFSVDLSYFTKQRDWKYKGTSQVTRDEFERELNNDRFRGKLDMRLRAFQDVIEEDRFIHLETDLALSSHNRGYGQIRELVSQWNKEVMGFSTLSTYDDCINFQKDFEKVTNKLPSYIRDVLWSGRNISTIDTPVQWLHILMDYSVSKINYILKFKKSRDTETLVKNKVQLLLENIKSIEPVRLKTDKETRITDFRYIKEMSKTVWLEKYNHNWDVFNTKEQLIHQLENIEDQSKKDIQLWEIKNLTDIEKGSTIKGYEKIEFNLSQEKLNEIIRRDNKRLKDSKKALKMAMVVS
tara:strand:+ start:117 stop:2372 length:2256 start_codon:yes stop_codon:yes gene_type:complete